MPGREWRAFVVSRRPVAAPEVRPTTWDSGVGGAWVALPAGEVLNRAVITWLLGVSE